MTMYFKVTSADGSSCHGGRGKWNLPKQNADGTWTPGRWRTVSGVLAACENGLHAATRDQLIGWLGEAIWEIEFADEPIDADDKVFGRKARLVRGFPQWHERTARIFAVECAEDVLHFADLEWRETLEVALYVARCYADGEATDKELAAAWAAAWDAARAAAGDAAWAAARAAAWDAARAAAGAAGDAAWAAARAAQTDRLMALLEVD